MPLEPICNAAFFFVRLRGPVNFFYFESHVDQISDRLGIRVEWQKLRRTFRTVRRQRKLGHDGGFRKREHQTFFLLHGHRSAAGQRWPGTLEDSSSKKTSLGKDESFGWFVTAYVR